MPTRCRTSSSVMLLYSAVMFGCAYAFAALTIAVQQGKTIGFDEPVVAFFAGHQGATLNLFFRATTWIGSSYLIVPIGIALLIVLLRSGRFRAAATLFLGYTGTVISIHAVKFIVARPRPDLFPHLADTHLDWSFPSGHAAQITAFALSLFLIVRELAPRWQLRAGVAAGLVVTVVATSRVYLGVHYPSDVLAGVSLAAVWVLGISALLGTWCRRL